MGAESKLSAEAICLGKFDHDFSAAEAWKSWLTREIISFYGRKIQVSEIL